MLKADTRHNQSGGFTTDAGSTPIYSDRRAGNINQDKTQQIKPQPRKPHQQPAARNQKQKWKKTGQKGPNRAPANKPNPTALSRESTRTATTNNKRPTPNKNKKPATQQSATIKAEKKRVKQTKGGPQVAPNRRISGFGSLFRRMSTHHIFSRRNTNEQAVKTEREKAGLSPSPTLNRHFTNEQTCASKSPPGSPVASQAQSFRTNNEGETPMLPLVQETLDNPVQANTRLIRGAVQRQSSEKLMGVSQQLFEEKDDIRNRTFPGARNSKGKQTDPQKVLRGYDFKPVNRSPRVTVRRKPQVWSTQRSGQNRTARNPSKLTSVELAPTDELSQHPSPVLEVRCVDTSESNEAKNILEETPTLSPLTQTLDNAENDQTDQNEDLFTSRLDTEGASLSRITSSPRVRELRLELDRKEAAFANRLKRLDAQLTDVKGKFGDMTTRTEPPATPPRLTLPILRTQPHKDKEESDSTPPLSPTTPTAAPVFGPVAMFSVPTLALVHAKSFVREETRAGAEEIDYMEDARRIVERLQASQAQEKKNTPE